MSRGARKACPPRERLQRLPDFARARVNANGRASPAAVLTVNVNGADVGRLDSGVHADLEAFRRPGANAVRLTFSAPSREVEGELRCLPPGESGSRNTILTPRPAAARLTTEAQVNLVRR